MPVQANKTHDANHLEKKKKECMKSKKPLFYHKNDCFLYQEDQIEKKNCGHMPTIAHRNLKK